MLRASRLRLQIAFAFAFFAWIENARAADAPVFCKDISVPRGAVESRGGRWIELTADQWQFLRGVFALNPTTPPGLPYGDKAALAQVPGDAGGLIFFLDGARACTPMAAPRELIDLINQVGAGEIAHEGQSE